jgi:pteridine reductase
MKNEAVLITGGTKRLGLELAIRTLDMGMAVIIHYRSDYQNAAYLQDKYKDRVFFIKADLLENPEELMESTVALPVKLVGLVNNASVFTEGDLSDTRQLKTILNVNTLAPVMLADRFSRIADQGWIINITDANVSSLNIRFMNYRISKLFLEELTRQQAFLYAPKIRVNAIAPGAMLPSDKKEDLSFGSVSKKIPLGFTEDLQQLADTYTFLVKNRYITGETIRVDGGLHLNS